MTKELKQMLLILSALFIGILWFIILLIYFKEAITGTNLRMLSVALPGSFIWYKFYTAYTKEL